MAPTKKNAENKKKKENVKQNKTKIKKNKIKPKRTHFQYTEEALSQALDAIRNKNMAIREACRKYCVPRSTVQDRISGRMVEKPRKVGPEPLLGISGEQKVVDWIVDLAKCGILINKTQLLETVKNIIKDLRRSDKLPDKRPGQTWYQIFLRRHPEISVREMLKRTSDSENSTVQRQLEEEIVEDFRGNIQTVDDREQKRADGIKFNAKQCKKIKMTDKISKIKETGKISREKKGWDWDLSSDDDDYFEYIKIDNTQGKYIKNDGEITQEVSAQTHQLKITSEKDNTKVQRKLEEEVVDDFRVNIEKKGWEWDLSSDEEDYNIF